MTIVYIISAPSGSGKSTLKEKLLADVPGLLFSVSYTTRKPRGKEVEGQSYHYISEDEFERRLANGEFLEHATVFGKCRYGTHRRFLDRAQAQGEDLVLDIDVQGARQLKSRYSEVVTIFVLPPSKQVLEERLRARGEDTGEEIQKRLQAAAEEIRNYSAYDYVLINRDKDEAGAVLSAIVLAERVRRTRMEDQIQPILETFRV
jgi:guanylate kinase